MWSSARSRTSHALRASASTTSLRSVSSEPAPPVPPPPTPRPTTYSTTTTAAAANNRLTPAKAFHRFEQARERIRWKALDLQMSYERANHPEECGFRPVDAERNFKVDFHEFYVWIEQALVLLLLFFGVTVPRGAYNGPQLSNHTYHQNVLQALKEDSCPVHAVLGQGDVMHALMTAKTLRNRWKGAAAEEGETPPLRIYNVKWIVETIWKGLEMGYDIAKVQRDELEREMEERQREDDAPERPVTTMQQGDGHGGRTDDEWEWMVEPMDWEAA